MGVHDLGTSDGTVAITETEMRPRWGIDNRFPLPGAGYQVGSK